MQSDPATVLATLLEHGLAPEPAENLPLEWRPAYEAMRSVRGGRHDRQSALEAALENDPLAAHKQSEIEQAAGYLAAPEMGQLRIYSAWETVTDPPALDWVVKGLFARPSLNLIVGAPGSKKTWLALDLAVCAASGCSWLGFESQPTPVLIVDEEGGLPRIWDRLHRIMAGCQAAPQIPLYFISMAGHNFALPNEAEHLAARAQYLKAGLIVIDALANVMAGTDENNVLSVQPVFANLRRLAQLSNAAVVVIHHTNKQGIFRGSTLMASGVDHMIGVESPAQDPLIQIRTLKARDLEPVSITARAHFQGSAFWLAQTDERPPLKYGQVSNFILNYFASQPSATIRELVAAHPSATVAAIRKAVHDLTKAGLIARNNGKKRGKVAIFQLSERGKSVARPSLRARKPLSFRAMP